LKFFTSKSQELSTFGIIKLNRAVKCLIEIHYRCFYCEMLEIEFFVGIYWIASN
jgi:hypothetical protein